VCHPGSYTNPYTVETLFTRDLGSTVILGGWVKLSGTDAGKSFAQKAASPTSGTKARKAGNSPLLRSPSPTIRDLHPHQHEVCSSAPIS
jgi:hypothetical protein